MFGCRRCQNPMVEEVFVDEGSGATSASFMGWRCVICGDILDPVILQNRRRRREPLKGRARGKSGGIPMRGPAADDGWHDTSRLRLEPGERSAGDSHLTHPTS